MMGLGVSHGDKERMVGHETYLATPMLIVSSLFRAFVAP